MSPPDDVARARAQAGPPCALTGPIGLLVEGFDPARGGAERAARAVAAALVRAGAAVVVVAPRGRAGPPVAAEVRADQVAPGEGRVGAPVRVVELALAPGGRRRALALAREAPRAARAAGAARVVSLGKLGPGDADAGATGGLDLWWPHGGVHAAAREGAARAGRGPVASALARLGRGLRPVERAYDAIEAALARACRAGGARAVALSAPVARDLRDRLDVPSAAVVPNGVDPARFAPPTAEGRARARATLAATFAARAGAAPAPGPWLLWLGVQPRLKGLDRALAALARLPDARLLVAGPPVRAVDAALRTALPAGWRRDARALAARVLPLGWVEDPRPLYAAADALLHPTRYDPCSLVVLEALAAGLPVVTTTCDGAAGQVTPGLSGEVVDLEHGLGAGAPAAQADALAAAVARATGRRAAHAGPPPRTWDDVARDLLALLAG